MRSPLFDQFLIPLGKPGGLLWPSTGIPNCPGLTPLPVKPSASRAGGVYPACPNLVGDRVRAPAAFDFSTFPFQPLELPSNTEIRPFPE
jgi:hypothetical protein